MNAHAVTSTQTGISRQTFLTLGTYLLIILFHSDTFLFGLSAAFSVILLQTISFMLLPLLVRHTDLKAVPYLSTGFAVIVSVLLYELFSILPVSGVIQVDTFLPDPMFLLLLVPLLMNQAQNSDKFKAIPIAKNIGIFTVMIICVSSIREILGLGTFFGMPFISQESIPVPFLAHLSGGAFLLLALTILSLYVYRKISGKMVVLSVLNEQNVLLRQPVLSRQNELSDIRSGLLSLVVSVPVILGLYVIAIILLPSYSNIALRLIITTAFLGITARILYFFAGKRKPQVLRILTLPWYFPAQIAVILLPFSFDLTKFTVEYGVVRVAAALFLYLCSSLLVIGCFLLLSRAIKRKLLFGERPALLSGLPLYILFAGLALLVISGFTAIPHMFMPK